MITPIGPLASAGSSFNREKIKGMIIPVKRELAIANNNANDKTKLIIGCPYSPKLTK